MKPGGSTGYWHKDSPAVRILLRCSRGAAVISSLFLVGVAVLVFAGWMQVRSNDPLDDSRLNQLRAELRLQPDREDLKEEIRTLDLLARRVYLSNLDHVHAGIRLLFAGLSVLLLSGAAAVELSRRLPEAVDYDRDKSWRSPGAAWRSLVYASAALGVAGLAAGLMFNRAMERDISLLAGGRDAGVAAVEDDVPDEEEIRKNWPGFRGPSGNGVSYAESLPLKWDVDAGVNVLWQVPLDAHGYGSPVIWGKKVFVTQADGHYREMVCLDLDTGEVLWQKEVGPYPGGPAEHPDVFDEKMHAASTPVTDGKRVYGVFVNGDIVCFDFDGKEIWGRNMGVPTIAYGHSSSPVLCAGSLIVQLESNDRHTLAALNPLTGAVLWQSDRIHESWSTPLCFKDQAGGSGLITLSVKSMSGFSVKDGTRLWTVDDCLSGEVGSSATWHNGMVYITSLSEGVRAYRLGDKQELVWHWEKEPSEMASPLFANGRIYIASPIGYITALSAEDGVEQWEHKSEGEYYASPVYGAGRVYALNRKGIMTVFEEGAAVNVLAVNPSGAGTDGTPAFAEGRIIIRTSTGLVCIGE